MIVARHGLLIRSEALSGEEQPFASNFEQSLQMLAVILPLGRLGFEPQFEKVLRNCLFPARAKQTMKVHLRPNPLRPLHILFWRTTMLAIHIAAEINQRWLELEKLESLDRLHVLETIIERHVLATGPCCSSSYVPCFEVASEFHAHSENDANRPTKK